MESAQPLEPTSSNDDRQVPKTSENLNVGNEQPRRLPKLSDLSASQAQYVSLLNQGLDDGECSSLLQVSRRTLYTWRQNPIFEWFLNESRKTLRARMEGHKPRAIERLGELIDSPDPRVRLAACMALLKYDLDMDTSPPSGDQIVEDTIRDIERFTTKAERIELARRIRAQLDRQKEAQAEPENEQDG